jgi:hypothetical protein
MNDTIKDTLNNTITDTYKRLRVYLIVSLMQNERLSFLYRKKKERVRKHEECEEKTGFIDKLLRDLRALRGKKSLT